MNIPVFLNNRFTETTGYLTSEMQLFMDQLNQVLRNGLSNNGWTLPIITNDELTSVEADMPDGTMWYVSGANEVVIKINGALRKVTTTAYP